MRILHSGEVDHSVLFAFSETQTLVDGVLQDKISASSLACENVTVLYVPIIVKDEDRKRYPARSRVQKKTRTINCCPQLDISVFLSGSASERKGEFLSGLLEVGTALAKLDFSKEKIKEYLNILQSVESDQ